MTQFLSNEEAKKVCLTRIIEKNPAYSVIMKEIFRAANEGEMYTRNFKISEFKEVNWGKFYELFVNILGYTIIINKRVGDYVSFKSNLLKEDDEFKIRINMYDEKIIRRMI